MSAQKKAAPSYHQLYVQSSSPDKKAVEDLIKKINGLLQDPKKAKQAALIVEQWLRHKPK